SFCSSIAASRLSSSPRDSRRWPIRSSARGFVGSRRGRPARPGFGGGGGGGGEGGRRGQSDRLADLAHGRGIAVPVDVVDEELPDLLLPCGQLRCGGHCASGESCRTCVRSRA